MHGSKLTSCSLCDSCHAVDDHPLLLAPYLVCRGVQLSVFRKQPLLNRKRLVHVHVMVLMGLELYQCSQSTPGSLLDLMSRCGR